MTLAHPPRPEVARSPEAAPPPAAAAAPNERPAWLIWLLIALAYAVATIIMTWPYAAKIGTSMPPQWDPPLQVWVMRWVQHALATDPRHLYDANVFYPLDRTLAYTDSNVPAAIIGAPIFILTGNAILTHNVLLLGTFVLAGTGMCALVSHLVGNRAIGFLAGLAYAFLPYRYDHIWHLNQLSHAWTPWAILALFLLVARPSWRTALAFGALTGIQIVSSFYVGFQLAFALLILVPTLLLIDRRARTPRFLTWLVAAAVIGAAIVLPLALPYLQVREQQGLERGIEEATYLAATPGSYFKVPMNNKIWGWLNDQHILAGEDTLFVGGLAFVAAIAGAVAGLRRRRALTIALLLIALVGFVISLGPTYDARGGGTFPLPYRFLFDHFPLFGAMRVPARFGALANFATLVLAGLGAAALWSRLAPRLRAAWPGPVGAIATGVVAFILLVELGAVPVRVESFQHLAKSDLGTWLAAQPDDGAVIHFPQPIPNQYNNAQWMLESTQYWKPLVYGYSGFIPTRQNEYMALFDGDLPRPDGTKAEKVNFVSPEKVGLLQDLGVRYLIVHEGGYKREDWPGVVAQLDAARDRLERVEGFDEGLRVYRVAAPDTGTVGVTLATPTVAAHGVYWEPTLILTNPRQRAALIDRSLFRPVTLTVTWRDAGGKVIKTEARPLDLPLVAPPGESTLRLQPDQPDPPGDYSAEIAIGGGYTLSRTVAVTVYDAPPAGDPAAPPLAFVGATELPETARPGDTLAPTLAWQALSQPTEELTVFAQLIGPDGKVWGQRDAPAGWTGHGTATWLAGEQVATPWPLTLPADAPPGDYRLLVGMYRRTATGVERVVLRYPDGDATEGFVGTLRVAP